MSRALTTLLAVYLVLSLGTSGSASAACDQTLSPGANLVSAVAAAPSGATICLNAGSYGTVNFSRTTRSNYVTVQSTSGRTATISLRVSASSFVRFSNLTVQGATIDQCSANIDITDSTFVSNGLLINMRGSSCAYPLKILINGNVFSNLPPAGYEGRISVADDDGAQASMGVVISNNEIRDGCLSDGVQLVGGASGIQIGPGNLFTNIIQSGPVHCDNIQFYGSGQNNSIIQNMFRSGSTFLTHHTAAPDNTLISNNIFDGTGDGAQYKLQIGHSENLTFEHNTLRNSGLSFTGFSGAVRNNIFITTPYSLTCSACAISHNVFSSGSAGTNALTGTPTLVGGSAPTTWPGYQLTTSSLGYRTASDGNDRGTNYYGPGTQPPSPGPGRLPAPSNLRIVMQ